MTDELNDPPRPDETAEPPLDATEESGAPDAAGPAPRRPLFGVGSVRTQLIVAVLLAALGFAAVVQVRLTRTNDNFGGQSRDNLVELLDSLSAAADRTRAQINDLESTRNQLLSSSQRHQAALAEGQKRLDVLQILAGRVAAEGPGVTITISDPDSAMTAATLLNGIEELRDAGAEAIEINDTVRVVASTSFTESNGVISADGVELRAPYVIDAIGSAHTLAQAVVFPGGLSDEVGAIGGNVSVRQRDLVEVGSLHTLKTPEYSQPTSG